MARKSLQCFVKHIRNIMICLIIISLLLVYKERCTHRKEVAASIPKTALKYVFFDKSNLQKDPQHLKSIVKRYNLKKKVLNIDLYGPIKPETVVFVIKVEKLSIYFEFLLVSLSQIRGIEEVLIVFSHTSFDENLNFLIRSIDFCRVVQIFYPYSLQMNPDGFPGRSPDDCLHNMNMRHATANNCSGSKFPDIHGHFRNPEHAQSKHLWWWMANVVFETLLSSKSHKGIVVFLKDDLYILEDFLYTILYMKEIADHLTNCEFLTLECMPFSYSCIKNTHGIEVKTWDPKHEPSVLAFDVNTWNTIVSHYDLFCGVDDYSWFRSLFYLSTRKRDGLRFRIISGLLPRAYKTSSCGLDGLLVDCDAIESVYQIIDIGKKYKESLFSAYLEVYVNIEIEKDFFVFDYAESNGGWSDPRDKELCNNLTKTKIKKVVMEMNNEFYAFKF